MKILLALATALLFIPSFSQANPMIEQHGRITIDWSTLKIRFYGEAKTIEADGAKAFENAERAARQEGLQNAQKEVKETHQFESAVSYDPSAISSGLNVARTVNTTYAADGMVRVDFEGALANALVSANQTLAEVTETEQAATRNTGFVIALDARRNPAIQYVIKDENGRVLYEIKHVAKSAYEKNLMGRWYQQKAGAETREAVGENPLVISAKIQGNDIIISRSDWEKAVDGNTSLLTLAKIALLIP